MSSIYYRQGKGRFTHYWGRRWDLSLCGQRSKRIEDSEYTTCPKCLALMKERGIPLKPWKHPLTGILIPHPGSLTP